MDCEEFQGLMKLFIEDKMPKNQSLEFRKHFLDFLYCWEFYEQQLPPGGFRRKHKVNGFIVYDNLLPDRIKEYIICAEKIQEKEPWQALTYLRYARMDADTTLRESRITPLEQKIRKGVGKISDCMYCKDLAGEIIFIEQADHLTPEDLQAFDAHIGVCESCTKYFQDMYRTDTILRDNAEYIFGGKPFPPDVREKGTRYMVKKAYQALNMNKIQDAKDCHNEIIKHFSPPNEETKALVSQLVSDIRKVSPDLKLVK